MSGKRQAKKEQRRAEGLEQRLADLYDKGADEAFLDLVHEQGRDLPAEKLPAERYVEVVERALRRALAGGDWQGIGRILKRLRRGVAGERPLVRLADSARDLVEGRLDAVGTRLALLESELPPGLASGLAALASPEGLAAHGPPAVREVLDLPRRLERLDGSSEPEEIESLRGAVEAVRAGMPRGAEEALAALERDSRLLLSLAQVEAGLRRAPQEHRTALDVLLEEGQDLRRPVSEILRSRPAWPLLQPLRWTVRLRWRRLLEILVEDGGPKDWVELAAVWPDAFELELDDASGRGREALEASRVWRQWHDFLELGVLLELADFLAKRSRSEKDEARRVDLWDVELWAWEEVARATGSRKAARTALARLEKLASETGQIPNEESRARALRRLRETLLELCEIDDYSRRFQVVAMALLEWRQDDPALLAVALASAVCSRDEKARDRFAAQIATRGAATGEDAGDVLAVVSHLAKESWPDIVETMPRLRPLLDGEGWEKAVGSASDGIAEDVLGELSHGWGPADLERLRIALESARRTLPDAAALPTLELAVVALGAGERAPGLLRRYLEENPALEAALVLYRALIMADLEEPGMFDAVSDARAAVTARLDRRWPVWQPDLRLLLAEASLDEIRSVRRRLEALLEDRDLEAADRDNISAALGEVIDEEEDELLLEEELNAADAPGSADRPPEEELGDDEKAPDFEHDEPEDWEEEPEDGEEDWDDDEEDLELPSVLSRLAGQAPPAIHSLLERLFPPPQLIMKPLGPAPEPLQEKDLEPLLRPLRRQAVEEVLRVGLGEARRRQEVSQDRGWTREDLYQRR